MTQNLQLEIVTPQMTLLKTEAEYVTIPGEIGELGILPGHIPVLTNLQSGILTYKSGGDVKKIAVHYGYAEVCGDNVTILANVAELAEDIDPERAKIKQDTAEKELAEVFKDGSKIDMADDLQRTIKKAITRQSVVS